MTIKDIPRSQAPIIESLWTGPRPTSVTSITSTVTRVQWTVDLTAQQASDFDDVAVAVSRGMDPVRYVSVKDDIATMQTFLGITTPTLAQNSAATKAIIRVLRALMRD